MSTPSLLPHETQFQKDKKIEQHLHMQHCYRQARGSLLSFKRCYGVFQQKQQNALNDFAAHQAFHRHVLEQCQEQRQSRCQEQFMTQFENDKSVFLNRLLS